MPLFALANSVHEVVSARRGLQVLFVNIHAIAEDDDEGWVSGKNKLS
ncbi:hypothetical protein SS1G_06518 [Sclerotinia sclerotiorum 1980 UF-70]|uniref:Uncharacterized protein n=1 Tax=Sclerotinia sclerotiorum (strain ATCC 18683 / 1980 / Ss-1) TaxID=665079 RepID=A7EMH0_SCLS1|nr:hypothetical protein SS1G_06518 [Sclerotinia sclerotiorum 1980 UF-70]EDO04036.1 hypothetical protein SS1G_06518 [Sclerotinia sclerotiorum 1980 UF-70]